MRKYISLHRILNEYHMAKINKILGKKLLSNEEIIRHQTEWRTYIDKNLIIARRRILMTVSMSHSFNPHLELKLQNDIEQLFSQYELSWRTVIHCLRLAIHLFRLLHWLSMKERVCLALSLYTAIQFKIELK